MSKIAGGMETICKDIMGTNEDRKKCLQNVKKSLANLNSQVSTIRGNACKLLSSYRESRAELFKELKGALLKDRESLSSEVQSLRKSFQKKQKELRQDLAEARKAWKGIKKDKKEKERKKEQK